MPSVDDELAAVKQRITDVEGSIVRVENQLAAAIEKRDRFEDDEKKWERYDGDVQRLAKKEEQLRELLLKEKEQLRDELKRKELALEREGERTPCFARLPRIPMWLNSSSLFCVLLLVRLRASA